MQTPHTYFSTKSSLLALTLVTTMTTTHAIHADNTQHFTKDTVTCATALVCKELTQFIQAQIDELKNSTDPDFDKLDALQTQLIAVENQKQKNQKVTIAAENQKQRKLDKDIDKQNRLLDAVNKTDAQIAVLRGALLEN